MGHPDLVVRQKRRLKAERQTSLPALLNLVVRSLVGPTLRQDLLVARTVSAALVAAASCCPR
jgi:hypothetical protein